MPGQLSELLSQLQAELPQLTQGELWILFILAAAAVGGGLFVFLKPRA